MSNFIDTVSFQFFPARIWEATPLGTLTLRQFLDVHKNPKESTVEVIKLIKEAAENNDLKRKDYLKQNNLYSFVPSVILDGEGRGLVNIIDYNPIMVVEFDKIDHAKELKERLFNNLKSVVGAWISPSGRGLKLMIRIPKPTSVEVYKQYYCGLAYYMSQYEGFDGVNFNIVLPLFLSYDKEILVREDAEEWTQRGGKIDAFDANAPIDFEIPEDIDEELEKEVVNSIDFLVDRIVDNAHPQLLGIAFLVGGWSAGNYIGEELAYDTLIIAVERNNYMNKNLRGYKATAKQMFLKGLNHPAEYKKK
jgi:hypothetical protein